MVLFSCRDVFLVPCNWVCGKRRFISNFFLVRLHQGSALRSESIIKGEVNVGNFATFGKYLQTADDNDQTTPFFTPFWTKNGVERIGDDKKWLVT